VACSEERNDERAYTPTPHESTRCIKHSHLLLNDAGVAFSQTAEIENPAPRDTISSGASEPYPSNFCDGGVASRKEVWPAECHVDFETRSSTDIATGVHRYCEDPNTDVLLAAYAFGDEPVALWRRGESCPERIRAHVEAGGRFVAHNCSFEATVWRAIMGPKHGWPVPSPEQWDCTAARAAAMGLPRDLAGAAVALGLAVEKDAAGQRLMKQMCKPRRLDLDGSPVWWEDEDRLRRLAEYCMQDVQVERVLAGQLPPLSEVERRIFLLDYKINARGICVDLDLVEAASAVVDARLATLTGRICALTDGQVPTVTQMPKLRTWLREQGLVDIEALDKAALTVLLSRADLPENVREVLGLRAEAAKSSTAKLKAYRDYAGSDGRLRDNLLYLGASRTGRFSGKGAQIQNLPRGVVDDVEGAVAAILSGDEDRIAVLSHPPLDVVSSCLRACLTAAPGKRLIAADFSNVEGRVLAWLAGQESTLQAFRDFDAGTGPDVYKTTAASIYNVPVAEVTAAQRTIGKVATLALGYGGGRDAFQKMAKVYGVEIEDTRADEIKVAWRKASPRIVSFWSRCERAALHSVRNPGTEAEVGRIAYFCDERALWCRLPSGRQLVYCKPHVHDMSRPWGEAEPSLCFWGTNTYTKKWSRIALYGGLLVENITQACARDLLVEAMLRTDVAGYHTVLSVHDEIVAEVRHDFGSLDEFVALMSAAPTWAEGCPIAAEGWEGARFRKK
jgi:DNA polymerase